MRGVLLVALGGALGSVARHLVGLLLMSRFGLAFPWGTLTVNLVGSFAIGMILKMVASGGWAPGGDARLFLAVGILGGFTTFSSYAGETMQMLAKGAVTTALVYALGSVVAGTAFAAAGYALVRTG
jgi:CrcB protein